MRSLVGGLANVALGLGGLGTALGVLVILVAIVTGKHDPYHGGALLIVTGLALASISSVVALGGASARWLLGRRLRVSTGTVRTRRYWLGQAAYRATLTVLLAIAVVGLTLWVPGRTPETVALGSAIGILVVGSIATVLSLVNALKYRLAPAAESVPVDE